MVTLLLQYRNLYSGWTMHRTLGKKPHHSYFQYEINWNFFLFHSRHLEFIGIVQILDKGCLSSLNLKYSVTKSVIPRTKNLEVVVPHGITFLLTLHKFQPVWQSFLSAYKAISVRWHNIWRKREKNISYMHMLSIDIKPHRFLLRKDHPKYLVKCIHGISDLLQLRYFWHWPPRNNFNYGT